MSINVMLVDDHKIVREGLVTMLAKTTDIEVVAQAASGIEAVQKAVEYCPDVIVMDLTMPELGGIEATRRIVAANSSMKVLVLSMVIDKNCVIECLKSGAKGYLSKDCDGVELLRAIRILAAGESYLCSRATHLVIGDYTPLSSDDHSTSNDKLTKREQEVLSLIAAGMSTKEMAFVLGVSIKTIEAQRSNIMKKLNLHSIAELTKFAIRTGLTSIGP